jgi:hypothetical protein
VTGTSVQISTEGIHTLAFTSIDNAGNGEGLHIIQIKIDKTSPTINHTQSPTANANGWNNTSVTVTFVCGDTLSGIASCTSPQTVTTEGLNQAVTGTATDNAGNTAIDPATVSIDKTSPTISAAADRAANGNGWYADDVTVSFTCGDVLSGIDTCSASKTLGEGANQSATGTASDAAGNTASASVSGINIDKTAPTLIGAPTTSPNANGWYNGDVIIHWTCADALSGISGSCPADGTLTGEGQGMTLNTGVLDKADNSAIGQSAPAVKIDRTPPTTTASVPEPLASGWYKGAVEVTLIGHDALSSVDATYYSVDGGAAQLYSDAFSFSTKGEHTITYWSVDKAGNAEDSTVNSITLKIDGIAPITTC